MSTASHRSPQGPGTPGEPGSSSEAAGARAPAGRPPLDPGLVIGPVDSRGQLAAARRLLGPGRGDGQAAQRMLDSALLHGIDLGHMWCSAKRGAQGAAAGPRQVCLIVRGAGGSAMTFTSTPANAGEEKELAAVIEAAFAALRGTALGQALLEVHEQAAQRALLSAGFRGVGTLTYLRRPTPRLGSMPPVRDWPEGVRVRRYAAHDDAELIAGLERTYIDTLDCPELCGLRETKDVLESHRATGRFDPNMWWLVESKGRVEGALLFNSCADQDSVELVYLGLSPALRGMGLGSLLVHHGLAVLAGRNESWISCAVDERNTPARRVYARAGFDAFGRRAAFVKPLRTSAAPE
ncbi:MAG: GNAT family N-acetyltransferase [Planctomycetota bacterium]|nr:GNAT family N-acetyltransferase [Planctomycetota bacterium]